ncbi:MAG: tRNA-specific 2-thiouridylase MnmA [Deltaproteobacteria bacterium ADurb.Bin510]|nr:MAG: tRNA-specific 2-thiouridylase MnmA [Deltaproteobacteria bacterium ADurb.Bin510]
MIAVALSGGLDSAAAAVLLHEQGLRIAGVTMRLGPNNPDDAHLERARSICRRLNCEHIVLDLADEFTAIQQYFCDEYLKGRTPNPCAICNRDFKSGLLFERLKTLGFEGLATGHYVRKGWAAGRHYLKSGVWRQSQEYFMGLISQEAIAFSSRPEVERLVQRSGIEIPTGQSSQDVCFIKGTDYLDFIQNFNGHQPQPGPIKDVSGRTVGTHRGALHYTVGQRKGLGMGFGERVYVLKVEPASNTVTIGSLKDWDSQGFYLHQPNFMKLAELAAPITAQVKTRYGQHPIAATIEPLPDGRLFVHYSEPYACGQLAAIYDQDDAILLAGIIEAE